MPRRALPFVSSSPCGPLVNFGERRCALAGPWRHALGRAQQLRGLAHCQALGVMLWDVLSMCVTVAGGDPCSGPHDKLPMGQMAMLGKAFRRLEGWC